MPTWLTIKASLYACGALIVLLAAQSVVLYLTIADKKVAVAQLVTANTKRDAAAIRAQDAAKAAKGWRDVANDRLELLRLAQAENIRLNQANQDAADAARLAADKANNDLTAWRRKYRALLSSDNCTRAQAALEAACSVESY